MAASGERHESLESRLADLDVAGRRGNHLPSIDQKGFGGIGADWNLARNRDRSAIQNPAIDLDAMRILGIKPMPLSQIQEAGFEPPFLLRKGSSAGRQLQVVQAQFVIAAVRSSTSASIGRDAATA